MEGKAHMAIGGALGLAVAQPIIITSSLAGLMSVEGKAHLAIGGAIGWVAAQPLTAWPNGLMSMEDKAHLAMAGAIRWVAAQPSFAYANHFNLLLIPRMSFTGFAALHRGQYLAALPDDDFAYYLVLRRKADGSTTRLSSPKSIGSTGFCCKTPAVSRRSSLRRTRWRR